MWCATCGERFSDADEGCAVTLQVGYDSSDRFVLRGRRLPPRCVARTAHALALANNFHNQLEG